MNSIGGKVEKVNNEKFYAITFDILVDANRPFYPTKILDAGYRDGDGKTFLDAHGSPCSKPKLLSSGGLLPKTQYFVGITTSGSAVVTGITGTVTMADGSN